MMSYKLSSWDLSELKPKDLQKDLKKIRSLVASLESRRDILKPGLKEKDFLKFLEDLEKLSTMTSKLSGYYALRIEADSSDQEASAKSSIISTELTKQANKLLFFSLWFKKLDEKNAKRLINASGKYHYFLEAMRKTRHYALKENEEKIINIKDNSGVGALSIIYSSLTSQFEYEFDKKKMTQNELLVLVRDPDPKKREKTYRVLMEKYEHYKDTISEIYKNIVNDWREENVNLRGYKDPIHVRNVVNDVPSEAVESLLRVCKKNQKLFHKFFEMKRKRLGLRKMRRFDLYAPVERDEKKTGYDEAVKLVLETFDSFSPEFKKAAQKVLDENHLHSKLQKNKNTGAFNYAVTNTLTPYVLVNYTGTSRDISTIAHELGHAVHSILAAKQTEFTNHACLPLAETASIFGEMVLSEKLMERQPDKAKEMVFTKLEEIYASIIRQAGFVAFEIKAHKMIEEGKTMDELSQIYIDDLREQLGPGIDVDDVFKNEWLYVPHIFHTPFYCYAYAFGNLLTLALYELYKEQGDAFIPKLLGMLSKGGSESPVDITRAVGVDICSDKFWQKGFDVIKSMIDSL